MAAYKTGAFVRSKYYTPFQKTPLKWTPRSKLGASKSPPRQAAHTRISNVWEYPPPPGNTTWDTTAQIRCQFLLVNSQGARTLYQLIEKIRCIYAVLVNKIMRYIFLCSCVFIACVQTSPISFVAEIGDVSTQASVFMSRFGRDLNPISDS